MCRGNLAQYFIKPKICNGFLEISSNSCFLKQFGIPLFLNEFYNKVNEIPQTFKFQQV